MKITPNRNMYLDGKSVQQGKPADVSKEEGELAIRMGWATLADGKPSGKGKSADGDGVDGKA